MITSFYRAPKLEAAGQGFHSHRVQCQDGDAAPIIEEKVKPDSIVYTDTFRACNALDVSEFHHRRINHSELFADQKKHINGIENFWNQAKRHMRKFNGIQPENFFWFLKECEWRFNGEGHQHLLKQLNH